MCLHSAKLFSNRLFAAICRGAVTLFAALPFFVALSALSCIALCLAACILLIAICAALCCSFFSLLGIVAAA